LKDAYYFSHDSNAKDDPKCVLLIEQLGLEGYGIFWVLIETLRDQPEYKYPLALIPALARRYNTTAEKMKTVVGSYGLFQIENDEFFFSESLDRRMEKRSAFRESQREKALKRWNNAGALPEQSQGIADHMPVKERKGKEKKVKDKESIEKAPVSPATESLYEQVRDSFIINCPSLPKPNTSAKWTDGRKKAVRDKKISVEEFTEVFKRIEQSDFLTGRKGGKDGPWHGCSFDWILKPANWQKINEGNYDNHPDGKPPASSQLSDDLAAFEQSGVFDQFDRR
jgi:hypothetical protein